MSGKDYPSDLSFPFSIALTCIRSRTSTHRLFLGRPVTPRVHPSSARSVPSDSYSGYRCSRNLPIPIVFCSHSWPRSFRDSIKPTKKYVSASPDCLSFFLLLFCCFVVSLPCLASLSSCFFVAFFVDALSTRLRPE